MHVGLLGCEELTYRRFKVLLQGLPVESRYKQAALGDIALWDRKDHRLADLFDAVVMLNHNVVQSKSKTRLKPPSPIKRPGSGQSLPAGVKKLSGRARPVAQVRALMDRWRGDPEQDGGDDGRS